MTPEASRGAGGNEKQFGDVMKRLIKKKRVRERSRYGAVVKAWRQVAGQDLAEQTRVADFSDGTLVIEVESSVLMQELSGYMKPTLLQELKNTDGGRDVFELRFRLGGDN